MASNVISFPKDRLFKTDSNRVRVESPKSSIENLETLTLPKRPGMPAESCIECSKEEAFINGIYEELEQIHSGKIDNNYSEILKAFEKDAESLRKLRRRDH